MRVRSLALVALALLLPATSAHAEAKISQRILDDAGQPWLTANFFPDGRLAPISWRACTPDCGDVVATGATYQPGATPPGTVFEAEATYAGVVTTDRTPAWQGQVTNLTPPTLAGTPKVGQVVTPVGGTWSGGWGDDFSELGLVACTTPASTDCRAVYGSVIDPAYAGWYLRAYDRRYGAGTAFPAAAVMPPAPGTIGGYAFALTPGATVAYGTPVGPIPPAVPGAGPTISGKLAVGQTITVRPGTWPDRPASSVNASALRACPTPKDTDRCIALTNPYAAANAGGTPPTVTFTLTDAQLGWYIGGWDYHSWSASPGSSSPTVVPPAVTAGVGATGQNQQPDHPFLPPASLTVLYGALSATPVGLGFTPTATLRTVAKRAGGQLTLGTLRCAGRCVAHVVVTRGKATVKRDVVVTKTTQALTVPAKAFKRSGTLRVAITYDLSTATKHARIRVP